MKPRSLLILAVLACLAPPLAASPDSDRVDRLVRLARVWATVRYQHPWLVSRDVDWDAPLLAAIPKVRAATSERNYRDAVAEMLASLGDPATRVLSETLPAAPTAKDVKLLEWDGDIAIVRIGPFAAARGVYALYSANRQVTGLDRAKALVVDTRAAGLTPEELGACALVLEQATFLVTRPLEVPGQRYVFHSGYRPQTSSTSGGYYTGFLSMPSTSRDRQAASFKGPVVFVTGRRPVLPLIAFALRAAGGASVVAEEPFGDEAVVDQEPVDLGGGATALIRTGEVVPTAGWRGVSADIVVKADPSRDTAFERALEVARAASGGADSGLRTDSGASTASAPTLPAARWRPDNPYKDMVSPDLPHRLLAAFRIWSVISRFYPYKHLIGDWDAALPRFIPVFEAAEAADDYARAVVEMTSLIEDGHTGAYGHPSVPGIFGAARIAVQVRVIERQVVVTKVLDAPTADAGIKVGDVILSVDGEPMADRMARLRKYVPASTEAARAARLAAQALRGAAGTARAEVRSPGGQARIVTVARVSQLPSVPVASGDPFRILEGDIGYADLTRLTVPEVDRMFDALGTTKAIIFDMRGYPQGTAWAVAPRINTRKATVAALFRRPQISGSSGEMASAAFLFEQALPSTDKPLYKGKTYMLIDERAISQAEHTGLFFEAAAGTEFIGAPTAGANGDVTNFTLPGGFIVGFTGHDVRHADGRQLQRVGLTPHLAVEPTIKGIADGRDEVLERALEYARR